MFRVSLVLPLTARECVDIIRDMTARDRDRILKIDSELLEAECEYDALLVEEAESGRTMLLISKTYKRKIERLRTMRNNLMRSISDKLDRKQTYSMILTERKIAVDIAQQEVDKIKQDIVQLGANAAILARPLGEEFNILKKALASATTVLANKERAVTNWLAKSEHDMGSREYKPRSTTMKSSYGIFKEQLKESVALGDTKHQVDFELKLTPSSEFDIKKPETKRAVNTTTFDMLMRPEEKTAMDALDSIELPLEDNVIELSVEEQEIREMEKMHSTQYKPVEI